MRYESPKERAIREGAPTWLGFTRSLRPTAFRAPLSATGDG